jgi:hypothetical protein
MSAASTQVTLEMELRLLRGYAALMSERFSDRVHRLAHSTKRCLAARCR